MAWKTQEDEKQKGDLGAWFGWALRSCIAEDTLNHLEVIYTHGRTRSGFTNYILLQRESGKPYAPWVRRHKFQAASDREALAHATEFVKKRWHIDQTAPAPAPAKPEGEKAP